MEIQQVKVVEIIVSTEEIPLPVEPLFTLEAVAMMLGTSPNSLRRLIHRNREALLPLYIVQGHRKRRVLTGKEIKFLQSCRIKGPGREAYLTSCKGSGH